MPVLLAVIADSGACLYISAASRYILRAMKMSPRISGVKGAAGRVPTSAVAGRNPLAASCGGWNASIARKERLKSISAPTLFIMSLKNFPDAAEKSFARFSLGLGRRDGRHRNTAHELALRNQGSVHRGPGWRHLGLACRPGGLPSGDLRSPSAVQAANFHGLRSGDENFAPHTRAAWRGELAGFG